MVFSKKLLALFACTFIMHASEYQQYQLTGPSGVSQGYYYKPQQHPQFQHQGYSPQPAFQYPPAHFYQQPYYSTPQPAPQQPPIFFDQATNSYRMIDPRTGNLIPVQMPSAQQPIIQQQIPFNTNAATLTPTQTPLLQAASVIPSSSIQGPQALSQPRSIIRIDKTDFDSNFSWDSTRFQSHTGQPSLATLKSFFFFKTQLPDGTVTRRHIGNIFPNTDLDSLTILKVQNKKEEPITPEESAYVKSQLSALMSIPIHDKQARLEFAQKLYTSSIVTSSPVAKPVDPEPVPTAPSTAPVTPEVPVVTPPILVQPAERISSYAPIQPEQPQITSSDSATTLEPKEEFDIEFLAESRLSKNFPTVPSNAISVSELEKPTPVVAQPTEKVSPKQTSRTRPHKYNSRTTHQNPPTVRLPSKDRIITAPDSTIFDDQTSLLTAQTGQTTSKREDDTLSSSLSEAVEKSVTTDPSTNQTVAESENKDTTTDKKDSTSGPEMSAAEHSTSTLSSATSSTSSTNSSQGSSKKTKPTVRQLSKKELAAIARKQQEEEDAIFRQYTQTTKDERTKTQETHKAITDPVYQKAEEIENTKISFLPEDDEWVTKLNTDPKKYCLQFEENSTEKKQYRLCLSTIRFSIDNLSEAAQATLDEYLSETNKTDPKTKKATLRSRIKELQQSKEEKKTRHIVLKSGTITVNVEDKSGTKTVTTLGDLDLFAAIAQKLIVESKVTDFATQKSYDSSNKEDLRTFLKEAKAPTDSCTEELSDKIKKTFMQELFPDTTPEECSTFLQITYFSEADTPSLDTIARRFKDAPDITGQIVDIKKQLNMRKEFNTFLQNPTDETYARFYTFFHDPTKLPGRILTGPLDALMYITNPQMNPYDAKNMIRDFETTSRTQLTKTLTHGINYLERIENPAIHQIAELVFLKSIQHRHNPLSLEDETSMLANTAGMIEQLDLDSLSAVNITSTLRAWRSISHITTELEFAVATIAEQLYLKLNSLLPTLADESKPAADKLIRILQLSLFSKIDTRDRVILGQALVRDILGTRMLPYEQNVNIMCIFEKLYKKGNLTDTQRKEIYGILKTWHAANPQPPCDSPTFRDNPLAHLAHHQSSVNNAERFIKEKNFRQSFMIAMQQASQEPENETAQIATVHFIVDIITYIQKNPFEHQKHKKIMEQVKTIYELLNEKGKVYAQFYAPDVLKEISS